ncbi:hypothetical protein H0E87_007095 [Populus deltoides]|uniref:HIT domain-containing protein n=1 Tax=Populus deltoides TaxID=3696 RepID=A0A8T2Z9T2_POPDE|nr:hypothetical protein H0E87_007095 [Populus deltoides]
MKSEILIFGNSDKLRAIAGVGKWRERLHHVSSARLPPNPVPLLSFTLFVSIYQTSDDKVVAFRDINPSAFRHFLVIPVEHIPTVNDLQKRDEDYSLDLAFISLHLTVLTIYTSIVWRYLSYPSKQFDDVWQGAIFFVSLRSAIGFETVSSLQMKSCLIVTYEPSFQLS